MSSVGATLFGRSLLEAMVAAAFAASLGGCSIGNPLSSGPPEASLTDSAGNPTPGAVSHWAQAYAKNPQDARVALGYARAMKAIGSKDQAFEILKTAYRRDSKNGEIASELGRLALDMGRIEVAKGSLEAAEAQGVRDWRTLSAQGTLRAKRGEHAEAQQYYLAALQEQPDSVSVINNLALSYALDGKADKAASLLRKAVDSGKGDKRTRQNLALVLGLEGKFGEAQKVASMDVGNDNAKASMGYLRDMLNSPGNIASLDAGEEGGAADSGEWQPYAEAPAPPRQPAMASAAPPAEMKIIRATVGEAKPATEMKIVRASVQQANPAVTSVAPVPTQGGSTTVVKTPPKPRLQAPAPASLTPPAEPAVYRASQ